MITEAVPGLRPLHETPIPERDRIEPLLLALGVTNVILDYPFPKSPTGVSWASPGHLDERVRTAGTDGIELRRSTKRMGPTLKYATYPGVFTSATPHWVEQEFGEIEHPSYQGDDATYTFTRATFSEGQYRIHTLVERTEGDGVEADFSVKDLRYLLRPPIETAKQTPASRLSWAVRQS